MRAPLENAPRFLSSAPSRGSNPRIRQQKARIPRDTGSAIRLAGYVRVSANTYAYGLRRGFALLVTGVTL